MGNIESLQIIQNSRRRILLRVLDEVGGDVSLREAVRRVAEEERVGSYASKNLMKSVQVSMLQTHIPRMERAGIIEYDRQAGVIHLLEIPSDVRYHLEVVERWDIPWSAFYLLLSLLGIYAGFRVGNALAAYFAICFCGAMLVETLRFYGVFRPVNWTLTKYLKRIVQCVHSVGLWIRRRVGGAV